MFGIQFELQLEQTLKQLLKSNAIILLGIQYIYSNLLRPQNMYPYYFPCDSSYYIPQYSQYYPDMNQIFQYYSINQQIKVQEPIIKNQQVNTNYSINDPNKKSKDNTPKQPIPQSKSRFLNDQSDQQNLIQKRKKISHKIQVKKQLKDDNMNLQPKFRYTHKNFESNIINKIFSFLWSQDKSKLFVQKILKDRNKTALYFDYIKIIRKYCKRYINKQYLSNLCDYKIEHIAYRIVMKQTQKLKYFSLEDFSMTVKKLIFIYLDTVCLTSILTSKKMRTDIWREHFEKMRNIRDFLFRKINAEEYDMRMSHSYRDIYESKQQ